MNASKLNLAALPMSDVLEQVLAAVSSFWGGLLHWIVETNVGKYEFDFHPRYDGGQAKAYGELIALSKQKPFLVCSRVEVQAKDAFARDAMTRHRENQIESLRYETSNGVNATLEVAVAGPQRALEIAEHLEKHFTFVSPKALTDQLAAEDPKLGPLLLREAAVGDLQAQLAKLGALLASVTERDVELRKQRMAELEAEHKRRVDEVEAERRKALDEVEAQRSLDATELKRKEAALQARIDAFNTQESKLERRDLQKKLNELLDQFETFKLSKSTAQKRWWVAGAALVMATLFVALAVISGYDYLTTLDWHYLPASSAGLLGFSATMLFFLKWSDRWFREHADEEMQSKRYKADMLRASWIAELVAEWAKDGKQAPPELLDVFARNLFSKAPDLAETEHPADALLGLVKRAQKLNVGKDGVSVETTGTSTRR